MSAHGINLKYRDVSAMSDIGGKAEDKCSCEFFGL